jgi:hypothetical protein
MNLRKRLAEEIRADYQEARAELGVSNSLVSTAKQLEILVANAWSDVFGPGTPLVVKIRPRDEDDG